ncbi:MAG: adenylate kinase [Clostridia bacterium]|nr:adenylate kinase [Clostridia bacterium]
MKIVLLGAPGSGKGTLAGKLVDELNIPTISTGDLLRKTAASGTEFGNKIKETMASGGLVSTETVLEMLKARLGESDTKNGYILDGFPRTIEQAQLLENIADIDACLYLDVDKDVIVDRLSGRITCRDCGKIYNSKTYKETTCECGGELYVRDDDKPEAIAIRFETYEKNTKPLIKYYQDKGILKTVKGMDDPMDTFKNAIDALDCAQKEN